MKATPARIRNLKPGDRIKCRPICRWNTRWTWRAVTKTPGPEEYQAGKIGVNYPSWGPGTFWIYPTRKEISEVELS